MHLQLVERILCCSDHRRWRRDPPGFRRRCRNLDPCATKLEVPALKQTNQGPFGEQPTDQSTLKISRPPKEVSGV